MSKQLTIKPLFHKGENLVGIFFPIDVALKETIKKLPDAKWSHTNKCWTTANNRENLKELFRLFKGQAFIDYSGMVKTENVAVKENNEKSPSALIPLHELSAHPTHKP